VKESSQLEPGALPRHDFHGLSQCGASRLRLAQLMPGHGQDRTGTDGGRRIRLDRRHNNASLAPDARGQLWVFISVRCHIFGATVAPLSRDKTIGPCVTADPPGSQVSTTV
jgi:hypothetical protein